MAVCVCCMTAGHNGKEDTKWKRVLLLSNHIFVGQINRPTNGLQTANPGGSQSVNRPKCATLTSKMGQSLGLWQHCRKRKGDRRQPNWVATAQKDWPSALLQFSNREEHHLLGHFAPLQTTDRRLPLVALVAPFEFFYCLNSPQLYILNITVNF